jgi:glucosamine-6-phosphate deaminase
LLNNHLLKFTNIKIDKVIWPKQDIGEAYDEKIHSLNGIDLLVLSIGIDGYIAFNESGTSIRSKTHNASLSRNTINNLVDIFDEKINVPTHAVTMGLKTILAAKKIILIGVGKKSSAAVNELMKGRYERS